jgi:hypothetical protein
VTAAMMLRVLRSMSQLNYISGFLLAVLGHDAH